MSQTHRQPGAVVRVLFQQITPATAKKALASSSHAGSGGGARDLRFRPYDGLQPFMEQMFPNEKLGRRRADDGSMEEITIRTSPASWGDGSIETELEYWPPTDARPNEGRIGKISSLEPLQDPPKDAKKLVALFVQDENELLWVRYASEEGLRQSALGIGEFILGCLKKATRGRIASGYIDFSGDERVTWCNIDTV